MIEARPSNTIPQLKGTWRPRTVDGEKRANVACPNCGRVHRFPDSLIGENGVVNLTCDGVILGPPEPGTSEATRTPCEWSGEIRLLRWGDFPEETQI